MSDNACLGFADFCGLGASIMKCNSPIEKITSGKAICGGTTILYIKSKTFRRLIYCSHSLQKIFKCYRQPIPWK